MERKKNYMDIACDKQAQSYAKNLGYGQERVKLKEKLNLF